MRKILVSCALVLVFALGIGRFTYAETMDIGGLIDNFYKATDLQRAQILKDNIGKEISAGGKVSNVGEYDLFDTVNDLKGTYYQASTEAQKTGNNVVYQLNFLFKDKDKAKDINKGENIRQEGRIIKIIDERLQISVWIFCGELAESDKSLVR